LMPRTNQKTGPQRRQGAHYNGADTDRQQPL
jgi:hypothetical protein